MDIALLLKKVYWHFFKTMPCEMILKEKWDEYRKIEKRYWENTFDISSMNVANSNIIPNKNIFVYWNQGFENAPLLVQKCYQQLQNFIPNGWTLITLTENNIQEYIRMPDFLQEMLLNESIYVAHYSDILRTALLYFYGGIWIDSTCFLTQQVPKTVLEDELFMFSTRDIIPYSPMLFENWFIRANRHHYVMGRMLENTLYYFKTSKNPKAIYFVYFYIMSSLYQYDAKARAMMDDICYCSNHDALLIANHYGFGAKYTQRLWNQIMNKSFVQKLTYKYDKVLETSGEDILLKHILKK